MSVPCYLVLARYELITTNEVMLKVEPILVENEDEIEDEDDLERVRMMIRDYDTFIAWKRNLKARWLCTVIFLVTNDCS